MAVRSTLGMGLALALIWAGCDGDVKPGIPSDGGDEWEVDAGGSFTPRDGGRGTGLDASGRDAGGDDEPDEPDEPSDDGGPSQPRADGGSQPGAPGDSSKFLGQPRCSDAFLFCDDFESEQAGGQPDPTMWKALYGRWPTVDTTRAARGSKSLHFKFGVDEPAHIAEGKGIFPMPNNTFYGRMFVWFAELPETPANAHWSIVAARGPDGEVRVDGQPGDDKSNRLGFGAVGANGWDWHTGGDDAEAPARKGRWTCIEWQLKGDTNETRMWIDGKAQPSLSLTSTKYHDQGTVDGREWKFPTFDSVVIGTWIYPISGASPASIDLWIDEVAFDDQQIGCER